MKRSAALILFLSSAAFAAEDPAAIAQRAGAEFAAGRFAESAALYRDVLRALPRSITARTQLARALARSNERDASLAVLKDLAEFGVRFDPSDAAWDSIRSNERFAEIESLMRRNTAPVVRSSTAFLLANDLIPENIAFDQKTRTFYVGSMYHAKIVKIDARGNVSDFVPPHRDGLMSVLGMKVDAKRRELWAASGNFVDRPPMDIDDPQSRGKGALFVFDLDSGRLKKRYARPGGSFESPTWFNDLVIAPDGDVYTTSGAAIWRVHRRTGTLEQFIEVPNAFFNGIAMTPDGKTIFAASHRDGVMRIDVARKEAVLVELPPNVTLGGVDGLYVYGRSLVAVQNGVEPNRVIRAWLDPSMRRVVRFEVLEQDHPLSELPLTGVIVGDQLYYVARSQLRAFRDGKIFPESERKETVILKLPIGAP